MFAGSGERTRTPTSSPSSVSAVGRNISARNENGLFSRHSNGKEAKLSYCGNVLMENRNGLAVDAIVEPATGAAERDAALAMAAQIPGDERVTLGGDKNYDTADGVEKLRGLNVTPHVAQNNRHRRRAIDKRTTRQPGYLISQKKRTRVEEIFGWLRRLVECGSVVIAAWSRSTGCSHLPPPPPIIQRRTARFEPL
jgi:hypothetical protein